MSDYRGILDYRGVGLERFFTVEIYLEGSLNTTSLDYYICSNKTVMSLTSLYIGYDVSLVTFTLQTRIISMAVQLCIMPSIVD